MNTIIKFWSLNLLITDKGVNSQTCIKYDDSCAVYKEYHSTEVTFQTRFQISHHSTSQEGDILAECLNVFNR